jgi:hypothetical protein
MLSLYTRRRQNTKHTKNTKNTRKPPTLRRPLDAAEGPRPHKLTGAKKIRRQQVAQKDAGWRDAGLGRRHE